MTKLVPLMIVALFVITGEIFATKVVVRLLGILIALSGYLNIPELHRQKCHPRVGLRGV